MSTVAKALALLEHFSETRPLLGLTELQKLSGRDKATVYRHLAALEAAGFLEQDPKTRAYRLGHGIERLAVMRRRTVRAADTIAPIVDLISTQVAELTHVNRLIGTELNEIYHIDLGKNAVRVGMEPDIIMPLLTTSAGKAILAFRPIPEQSHLIAQQQAQFGSPPMPDTATISAELRKAAERGYVTSVDTLEVGVSSVGIPLFDGNARAVAACAVAFPTARRTDALLRTCIATLFRHGGTLVERMGGVVPSRVAKLWAQPVQLEKAMT